MSEKEITNKTDEVAKITQSTDPTVEVLYQKLGDKWYAFSIIGDDVFFSPVPDTIQYGLDSPKKSV